MKTIKLSFFSFLACLFFSHQTVSAQAGITWVNQTDAANNVWQSVTYGKDLFVAVASNGTGDLVMTSPDGITWTSRNCPDSDWYAIIYGNGLFVAVGKSAIMTSLDGINWINRTPPQDFNAMGITYANGLFVAVGNGYIYKPRWYYLD